MSNTTNQAQVAWINGQPRSERFDDVYFSRENGLEESRYVFIEGNHIPSRLSDYPADQTFVIVETGFGTGLNFLLTLKCWQELPHPKPRLYFLSVEKYPLRHQDLLRTLHTWSDDLPFISDLLDQYPAAFRGFHELLFCQGKVRLGLLLGDVNETLPHYAFCADAFYLDGFAPSKNPDMWQQALFNLMSHRSKPGATFSTFTAAGFVRRGLQEAGFKVTKSRGYGRKRDMLVGTIAKQDSESYFPTTTPKWCFPESAPKNRPKTAIIIGGGLAGAFCALSLSKAGIRSTMLEQSSSILSAASGQPQLALFSKLPSYPNREARFILQAKDYSFDLLNSWQSSSPHTAFWHPTGQLQLAWNEKEHARIHSVLEHYQLPKDQYCWLDAQEASHRAGIKVSTGGLWIARSGWLSPKRLAEAVYQIEGLEIRCKQEVINASFNSANEQWHVSTQNSLYQADMVVWANAHAATDFFGSSVTPSKPLRGQISRVNLTDKQLPQCVICGEGYLCPESEGYLHFGATYNLNDSYAGLRQEDDTANAQSIRRWLPGWLDEHVIPESASYGFRCTTPDYHPIAGPIPDAEKFLEAFSCLRTNARSGAHIYGEYLPNAYICGGFGSKGLLAAPLCAELIAAMAIRHPLAASSEFMEMTSPARFLIRRLKKGIN